MPTDNHPSDSDAFAQLLFMLFVHVTDVDKEITPYDVQRLIRLLKNTQWMNNALVRAGLERLRPAYSSMWARYDSAALAVSLPLIAHQLDEVLKPLPNEVVESVRVALHEFIQKFGVPVSERLGRMRPATASSKDKARDEVKYLIASYGKALATAAPVSPPAQTGQPRAAIDPRAIALWPAAATTPGADHWWTGGRLKVRCVHVAAETHDVKTFAFAASPSRLFRYRPGQFVTLELPIAGQTVRRSYTLSSSPARPHVLTITVKRVPNGVVSNWLHQHMVEGFEFHLNGPFGQFTCLEHPNPKLLLVSGGSGITPMMSMLRWLYDTRSPASVVFINNVRTPSDVIFERELAQLAAAMGPSLQMAIVPGRVDTGQSWNGAVGTMSEPLLKMFAPDLIEREVFVCGPGGYMTMVKNMVTGIGLPAGRFHQESFGGPPVKDKPVQPAPAPARSAPAQAGSGTAPVRAELPAPRPSRAAEQNDKTSLTFERSGKVAECTPHDFILDIAERHGVDLPSACRAGACGTCRVRKLAGTVQMDGQQALNDDDLREGYVLACVGRPQGRVVIDA